MILVAGVVALGLALVGLFFALRSGGEPAAQPGPVPATEAAAPQSPEAAQPPAARLSNVEELIAEGAGFSLAERGEPGQLENAPAPQSGVEVRYVRESTGGDVYYTVRLYETPEAAAAAAQSIGTTDGLQRSVAGRTVEGGQQVGDLYAIEGADPWLVATYHNAMLSLYGADGQDVYPLLDIQPVEYERPVGHLGVASPARG